MSFSLFGSVGSMSRLEDQMYRHFKMLDVCHDSLLFAFLVSFYLFLYLSQSLAFLLYSSSQFSLLVSTYLDSCVFFLGSLQGQVSFQLPGLVYCLPSIHHSFPAAKSFPQLFQLAPSKPASVNWQLVLLLLLPYPLPPVCKSIG